MNLRQSPKKLWAKYGPIAVKLLKSLFLLSIGLKDDAGDDLVDVDVDPWNSLPAKTVTPQREELAKEKNCRYYSENLLVRAGMKEEPKPKQWNKIKC
jgi:hypothetical protein